MDASPFLLRFAHLVPDGRVLDVACGDGRHTRLFLARGYQVTAVDRDLSGVADLAGRSGVRLVEADLEAQLQADPDVEHEADPDIRLEAGQVARSSGARTGGGARPASPFAGERFAGVVVTNYLHRPLFPWLVDAVAPGGVLLYETFARGNERFGRPRNPDFLLEPHELLRRVDGELEVVAFEQGRIERPGAAVVQRLCAVRAREGGFPGATLPG